MLAQIRQTQREYISGESHYLLGKPYMLEVIKGGSKYEIKSPQQDYLSVLKTLQGNQKNELMSGIEKI